MRQFWEVILPVESRFGFTYSWTTLLMVESTLPFLSSAWPVTKTRKFRLRTVVRGKIFAKYSSRPELFHSETCWLLAHCCGLPKKGARGPSNLLVPELYVLACKLQSCAALKNGLPAMTASANRSACLRGLAVESY